MRQQTEQRKHTESDLAAVRDLCVKLDQQKEMLMCQMSDKDYVKNQVIFFFFFEKYKIILLILKHVYFSLPKVKSQSIAH